MRAPGYSTLTLAAIVSLGTVLTMGMHAADQPRSGVASSDPQAASTARANDASHPLQPLDNASELSSNVANLPTADRRDCEGGRLALPRLSQLPRALCDAAEEAGSAATPWRCTSGGRAADDDRPHFSPTLVIEHVRLQI